MDPLWKTLKLPILPIERKQLLEIYRQRCSESVDFPIDPLDDHWDNVSPAQAWGVYNSHVQIRGECNYYEREDVPSLLVHDVVDEVLAADI